MKLNKSLGQHFLIDENICINIFNFIQSVKTKAVLEIGPGIGALTKHFVQHNLLDQFLCCEIDLEKVDFLKQQFPALKGKVIHQDILKIPKPFDTDFVVAGNFPYNISSQIIFKVLDWKDNVNIVVGMFQKEVATRIASKNNSKNYSIISVLVQAFYDCTILFNVSPNSFRPPPKVDSTVIFLNKKTKPLDIKNFKLFKHLVKTAFSQRRKKLRNTLSSLFNKDFLKDDMFDLRAENLSIENFYFLYTKLEIKNLNA